MCLAAASYALAASSAVSNVPSHNRAPRLGSRISAAQLPHGRCLTPRYCDVHDFFDCLSYARANNHQPSHVSLVSRALDLGYFHQKAPPPKSVHDALNATPRAIPVASPPPRATARATAHTAPSPSSSTRPSPSRAHSSTHPSSPSAQRPSPPRRPRAPARAHRRRPRPRTPRAHRSRTRVIARARTSSLSSSLPSPSSHGASTVVVFVVDVPFMARARCAAAARDDRRRWRTLAVLKPPKA